MERLMEFRKRYEYKCLFFADKSTSIIEKALNDAAKDGFRVVHYAVQVTDNAYFTIESFVLEREVDDI